jgi:RimJ/RimL family protein N-acetyltransferase
MATLFPPRAVTLRDARTLLLRPATLDDADAFWAHDQAMERAREGVMLMRHELAQSPKEMAERYHNALSGDAPRDAVVIGAFDESAPAGRAMVGEVGLSRLPYQRLRHTARLGLGIQPSHQGVGLGRALLDAAIEWARATQKDAAGADTGVLRIELYVMGDNARAIALYESTGFRLEGRHVDKIRDPDGSWRDDLTMALWIR